MSRDISKGSQTFENTDPNDPVGRPLPKYEAKIQCTGEAEYIDDIPSVPGELVGYFVLAKVANCDLDVIDASAALVSKDWKLKNVTLFMHNYGHERARI